METIQPTSRNAVRIRANAIGSIVFCTLLLLLLISHLQPHKWGWTISQAASHLGWWKVRPQVILWALLSKRRKLSTNRTLWTILGRWKFTLQKPSQDLHLQKANSCQQRSWCWLSQIYYHYLKKDVTKTTGVMVPLHKRTDIFTSLLMSEMIPPFRRDPDSLPRGMRSRPYGPK